MHDSKDIRRICPYRRRYPDEPDIFFYRGHISSDISHDLSETVRPEGLALMQKPLPWGRETGRKTFPAYTFPLRSAPGVQFQPDIYCLEDVLP